MREPAKRDLIDPISLNFIEFDRGLRSNFDLHADS